MSDVVMGLLLCAAAWLVTVLALMFILGRLSEGNRRYDELSARHFAECMRDKSFDEHTGEAMRVIEDDDPFTKPLSPTQEQQIERAMMRPRHIHSVHNPPPS